MNNANGSVFKYPDNVDTDVIIPARHLNTQDAKELASHCMEDIDKDFIHNVKDGDIRGARRSVYRRPVGPDTIHPPSVDRQHEPGAVDGAFRVDAAVRRLPRGVCAMHPPGLR